jgi:hypothetical protein
MDKLGARNCPLAPTIDGVIRCTDVWQGIVTAVTAVAMTVPAVGLADQGDKPDTTPPMCYVHKDKGKHTGQTKNASKGKRNGASKGNKYSRHIPEPR